MNSRAAVEETAEERALNSIGLEEEIIELQDLRMSPIPSLRNRHKAKYYKEPGGRLHGMCPSLLKFFAKTFVYVNCYYGPFFGAIFSHFLDLFVASLLSIFFVVFHIKIRDMKILNILCFSFINSKNLFPPTFQAQTKASRQVSECIETTAFLSTTGEVTMVTGRTESELGYSTNLRRGRG